MLTIENILLDYAQSLQGTEQLPLVGWRIHSDKKTLFSRAGSYRSVKMSPLRRFFTIRDAWKVCSRRIFN